MTTLADNNTPRYIALITLRNTPRSYKIQAYSEMSNGMGKRLMKNHPLHYRSGQVINLLIRALNELGAKYSNRRMNLKETFDQAQKMYPTLMKGVSYIAANPKSKLPARLLIKE